MTTDQPKNILITGSPGIGKTTLVKRLFATIAQKGSGPISEIKQRQDAKLFVMTHHNRDTMIDQII